MTGEDQAAAPPEAPPDPGATKALAAAVDRSGVDEVGNDGARDEIPGDIETADVHAADYSDDEPSAAPDDGLTPRERRLERLRLIRQRKRERRIWIAMLLGGVAVLVAFLYFFWPVMAGRLSSVKQIDEAQSLLEQAKPTVDGIDKIVTTQLSPNATAGVPDVATRVLVARTGLKRALALLSEPMPHLADDEVKRAQAVQSAVKARLVMVDQAPVILATSAKAVDAKAFADRAWALAESASAAETAAVGAYNSGKASSIASASVVLQRAGGQLGDAGALYSQATAAFPGAGFERYSAAASLRAQAANSLSQVLSTWMRGDIAGASLQFTSYRTAAAKASAAAAKLAPAPNVPGQAFRRIAGVSADAYSRAKKQAADADKALEAL